MPKKINGAGELQNYVPKGNGDPSGEYGDKETGGNVHWKPKSESNPSKAKASKSLESGFAKGVDSSSPVKSIQSDMESAIRKAAPQYIEPWESGTDESRGIVSRCAKGLKIERGSGESYFSPVKSSIFLGDREEGLDGEDHSSETLFHELGHAVDTMGSKYDGIVTISVTKRIASSGGKTLHQTIVDELNKEKVREITREYIRLFNGLEINGVSEMDEIRLSYEWADISDMVSGFNGGKSLCGFGHSQSYWEKNPYNRGIEFFAEMFSAKSSRDKRRYELAKRLLPKSVAAFDELYEQLKTEDRI